MKRLRSLQRRAESRPASFFVSIGVHAVVFVVVAVLARRVAQAVKPPPPPPTVVTFQAPPPPPPPPPAGHAKPHPKKEIIKPEIPKPIVMVPPKEIPKEAPPEPEAPPVEEDAPEVEGGVEGGVPGGVIGGVVGGTVGGVIGGVLGNPLPEDLEDPNDARAITVGVTPPKLLRKVPPEYPSQALREKIYGEVIVKCIITTQGDVQVQEILQAPRYLDDAATRAIKRWKYEPAVYKGHPQAVFLIIRMSFTPPKS